MKKKAIFPGTFDPFTLGHESLVKRSLSFVDEIVIAIGINDTKKSYFSIEDRIDMIQSVHEGDSRVFVETYNSLTVDYAKKIGADLILRGIRTINDFEYEKSIADMNRHISGIETIILFTEPELTHISSTAVRELIRYNHDIRSFIPEEIKLEKYIK